MSSLLHVHFTSDYKAGVNAGVHRNRLANSLFYFRAYGIHQLVYFSGSPDSSDRVILVDLWDTEKRHDRIADKLLDKPPVFGHHLSNLPEDPAHDLFDLFRIKPLGHGCISRQVREEDGYVFSLAFGFRHFFF